MRVQSDAVSACTVHPVRLGETAGIPPVAGFPASGHGPCHRPACPSCGSRRLRRLVITKDASRLSNDHGGQAQSSEGRFLPAVSPRPRRRPLGNGLVAFVVRADPNPTASFCPLCLPPRYAARMLNSSGCGGVVGFTPVPRNLRFLVCERDAKRLVNAVNGGAFSSILRNVRSVLEGVRAGAARVVTPGRSPGPSERNVFISTLCIRIHERWPSGRRVERRR